MPATTQRVYASLEAGPQLVTINSVSIVIGRYFYLLAYSASYLTFGPLTPGAMLLVSR